VVCFDHGVLSRIPGLSSRAALSTAGIIRRPGVEVLIYIASFAGLLSIVVLGLVYLADRYEPEPIELIQNSFLFGFVVQLVLVLAATAVAGQLMWSGAWLMITVGGVALAMPFQVRGMAEVDERFDGVVYTVACLSGATCVVHLNNLPQVAAASPFHEALDDDAVPGLRDLLIIDSSPGFAAELGQGLMMILVGVLVGAALGVLHQRGWTSWRTAAVCCGIGLVAVGLDVATGGSWPVRAFLTASAVLVAVAVKRRSVFKGRPQPVERDVVVLTVKTALMVLGAALIAIALLQIVSPQIELPVGPGSETTRSTS
jgi:hypothetical protein